MRSTSNVSLAAFLTFSAFSLWAAALPAWAAPPASDQAQAQAGQSQDDAPPARLLGDAFRAFEAQDFRTARDLAARAADFDRARLLNRDYVLYVLAQSAFFLGDHEQALGHFRDLARESGSRFRDPARWRQADCLWHLGRYQAARAAYGKLAAQAAKQRRPDGDVGVARFRMAEALARTGKKRAAMAGFRAILLEHPAHPLAARAEQRLVALGGARAARLDARARITRAQELERERRWHEAVAELAQIGDGESAEVLRERDYWTAMTLFSMRRRYGDAGEILLGLYKEMGSRAAEALFHGARALSRADRDAEAVTWYQRVVAEYPRSRWADEAQFLAGWLEYNMGNYAAAVPVLETMLARYPRSRWTDAARWTLGYSHYLMGAHEQALPHFAILARKGGRLVGGKGQYWHSRALQKLGRTGEANRAYRELVGRFPFSWYAHLARARLTEQGIAIGPFGDEPRDPAAAPAIAETVDESLARDPLIRTADELLDAGLTVEAGVELRRGERGFLRRHDRAAAMAMLMDRYRRASNFNRPWMLAVVHGRRRALDAPPEGQARVWWEHAYPLAYRALVEEWRALGDSPPYYLYAIMRKESGFDPHIVSYADAIGLLQMIPPTTRRVVGALGLTYTADLLYEPELNIKAGSWYIGRLFHKFLGQVPLAAGSFNSGPRPVMRWIDEHGRRPIDELVELVSYRQTRGYMKKVTETYSRYLYLYEGIVYEQPLEVDAEYVDNELTY